MKPPYKTGDIKCLLYLQFWIHCMKKRGCLLVLLPFGGCALEESFFYHLLTILDHLKWYVQFVQPKWQNEQYPTEPTKRTLILLINKILYLWHPHHPPSSSMQAARIFHSAQRTLFPLSRMKLQCSEDRDFLQFFVQITIVLFKSPKL